jgi:hypothetical protein
MSLEKSVTRDCAFDVNKEGKYYFTIKEGNSTIFQSKLYDTSEDCTRDGIGMLDILHERNPIRTEYVPSNAEYGVKYSG